MDEKIMWPCKTRPGRCIINMQKWVRPDEWENNVALQNQDRPMYYKYAEVGQAWWMGILRPCPTTIYKPSDRSKMTRRTNTTLTLMRVAWATRIGMCNLTISGSGGCYTIVDMIFSDPYRNVLRSSSGNNKQKAWEDISRNVKIDKNMLYCTTQSIHCSINSPKWLPISSHMSTLLFLMGYKRHTIWINVLWYITCTI